MRSSHYKLSDLFKVINVAKCQIKLLKGDEGLTSIEEEIMGFKIDTLFPSDTTYGWRRKRQRRGHLTQKQFRNLQSVFIHLLPGITKNNLQQILHEVREKDWKRIVMRRQSKLRWNRNKTDHLSRIEDKNYVDSVLTLEKMGCPNISLESMKTDGTWEEARKSRHDRSSTFTTFKFVLEAKYKSVAQLFMQRFTVDNPIIELRLELYRYRTKEGRSGLMFSVGGYRKGLDHWFSRYVTVSELRYFDSLHGNTLAEKEKGEWNSERLIMEFLKTEVRT